MVEKSSVDEKFDDAVAAGKLVVMGKSEKEKQKMTLNIGNILPLQTVKVTFITI